MLVTDAQIHVWEVDRADRPWPANRNQPQLPNGFSAEQAIAAMDAAGVDRAVIVPPTWVGENNLTALEAAGRYPSRFAVMGRFDPMMPDAADRLEMWKSQPGMLGVRMTYRIPPYNSWLDDDTLGWFWDACERLAIPVMNLVPAAAPKLARVAEAHPALTLIIDHMARDLDLKGPEAFADLDDLLSLAVYPNVSVKVSSVPNFSKEPYPYSDVEPFLRRMYDAFGPRRLMWGSDITRLESTYPECINHFREALPWLSNEDRDWITGRAISEAINWPE